MAKSEIESKWKDKPHLTTPTIEFLEKILTSRSRVLEMGSGASTLWLAKRVRWVTSFEHNEEWFKLVMRKLQEEGLTNYHLNFMPEYPTIGIPLFGGTYDLVFVDGRGRNRSIKTTYTRVEPKGYLLLDDSHGQQYKDGIKMLDSLGWKKKDIVEESNHKTATAWRKL